MIVIQNTSHTVFQENTYFIIDNKKALIIDPGDDPRTLIKKIESEKCTVQAVMATHGHTDHIFAAKPLCEHYECPFIMNSTDREWLKEMENLCLNFGLPYYGTPVIDIDIADEQELKAGDFTFHIIHTPGHSPGSVCFLFDKMLFSGDTLFYHSVGRCDLPGGDGKVLRRSVREKLFNLPEETTVYPGHMAETTIKEEKINNPFLQ